VDTIDPCPDYIATYALAIEMARDGDERVRAFFRGDMTPGYNGSQYCVEVTAAVDAETNDLTNAGD